MHITYYDCQASFFIDVNLQGKELRKIVKFWWAVEGITYRGRCKSLLCAEMTLVFQASLGCAPITPGQFMRDMIPLSCPILFHLKLMWDDKGARVQGALKSVKTQKLVFLGVIFLNAPSSDFDEIFLSGSPISLLTPYVKNDMGVQPY